MTLEQAFFILRHGSAEGNHKYLEAVKVIEDEYNRQKVELKVLKDREKMPIPYDEDEFLRKAILQVIGWIEEVPNYKTFGMLLLSKTRVDEWKANIKKGGDTE